MDKITSHHSGWRRHSTGQSRRFAGKRRWVIGAIIGVVGVTLGAVVGGYWWYSVQLTPLHKDDTSKVVVIIASGMTPEDIGAKLQEDNIIRSKTAFVLYARFAGVQDTLQAGSYRLSASQSVSDIVTHLQKGITDTFSITLLPGATLAANRTALIDAGYDAKEVDTALQDSYSSPLFAGKPASADLEGYIYGETYSFATNTSVHDILEYIFSYYYSIVQENDLITKYNAHGLNLYQGITLASIVQREASAQGNDMAQIAQVFYSRLSIDMPLGSDVTYQYIADKTGVARDPNLDSPYNTRRYAGLPPGPIAVPGEKALKAVASPADGDYLYFLSGDDGITYFARTLDDHEANIANHCQEKCKII